jgi:glycosyltransferase involved in cell wall biosynthesis
VAKKKSTRKAPRRPSNSQAPAAPANGNGRFTLAHVTHEAVEHLGGIGTVLQGLITSPVYQQHVGRTILVGPCQTHVAVDPTKRLGEEGTVLYSSVDEIDEVGIGARLRPIEWSFNVKLVYGRRRFRIPGDDHRTGEADVLLIDVFNISRDRLARFKFRLHETFGVDSMRYDRHWDYEEYVRLAEPAFYALNVLLSEQELPCVLLSHEFMGMPAALKCILDGQHNFRTIFHAHECATARHLVEHHPGHDTMFYNVLRQARAQGLYVEDVFGDLSAYFRHALISRSHCCDAVMAVGDYTAEEMHFLGSHFDHHDIELVYNGVPAFPVTLEQRNASRGMLADYSEKLLDDRPDVLMTHVTRPVISKGLWRDIKVCHHLDRRFAETGRTGVLYILTTGGGVRRPQDVRQMEQEYGWPRDHREGYPDLVGPEVDLWRMAEAFNAEHEHVQVVLVNQFGWSPERIGRRLPKDMDIADLRRAADVEFGMATYEPFGISPLEPLGSGAVCVISNVCGCEGFVEWATGGEPTPNVLVADFTRLPAERSIEELKHMGRGERDAIEDLETDRIAAALIDRIPATDEARQKLIDAGQQLVRQMGWDQVVERKLLPVLRDVTAGRQHETASAGA